MIKMLNKLGEKIKKSPFLMGVLQDPRKKESDCCHSHHDSYLHHLQIDRPLHHQPRCLGRGDDSGRSTEYCGKPLTVRR